MKIYCMYTLLIVSPTDKKRKFKQPAWKKRFDQRKKYFLAQKFEVGKNSHLESDIKLNDDKIEFLNLKLL